jgi:hypothetical protein
MVHYNILGKLRPGISFETSEWFWKVQDDTLL